MNDRGIREQTRDLAESPSAKSDAGVSNFRNVVANWGSFLLSAVAGLFLAPLVVHALGPTDYGVWVIIGSLTGSMGLLDLGVRSAITRLVARAHAMGAHSDASRIASTARIIYRIAGSIAIVITLVLVAGMTSWFKIPTELAVSSRVVLLISGLSVAVLLGTGLYGGILTAVNRLDIVGFSNISTELLRVVLVLAVLYFGGGLVGLGLVVLLLTLVRYEYQRIASVRCYPELHLVSLMPQRSDVRSILDVSLFSTLIYSMSTVSAQVSVYVLGAMLPVSTVTVYAIGATLPSYAQALSLPIAQVVLPQASRLDAKGSDRGVRELILSSGRLGTLALLPVTLAFITHGPAFIGIWMGADYRDASGAVLVVLSLSAMFGVARHVMQTAFVGTGSHRHLVVWYVLEALVAAVLSVLLVSSSGVLGAAWAVVIPSLVVSIVILPILVSRHFGLPASRSLLQFWVRPLAAMVPYAVACWLIAGLWPPTNYVGFFAQIALLLPLAAVGACTIGLTASERFQLKTAIRRLIESTEVGIRRLRHGLRSQRKA